MKKVKSNKLTRRILSFVLTTALVVGLMPGNVMTVRAEESSSTELSVTAFATPEQLMSSNNFALHTDTGSGTAQKVYFGMNGESQQTWYIAGSDADNSIVLLCDPTLPMTTGCFDDKSDLVDTDYKIYDNNWNCTYGTAPSRVYANHYGASDLRLITLPSLESSAFSTSEQDMMLATKVYTDDDMLRDEHNSEYTYYTTDKLYAAYGVYEEAIITVGENSADSLNSGLKVSLTSGPYTNDDTTKFYLRTPYLDQKLSVHNVSPKADEVGMVSVKMNSTQYAVVPAFRLNLASVLFASSAPAATPDASLTDTMTFRVDDTEKIKSKAAYATCGVTVNYDEGDGNVFLYVQDADSVYSVEITEDTIVALSDMTGINNLTDENTKIWLEKSEDNVAYAVMAEALLTEHIPNADDGDCTTAITCSICGTVTTEAKENHIDDNGDGICDHCDSYVEPKQEDEYYQIANANNLMWLAQQVNEGRTTINAKLTADIDMKDIDWTTMSSFAGTFDGDGHTISGLNGHIDMWAQVQCHGFIRTLNNGGFVKNLTFTGAKVFNHEGSGAISAIIVYTNQGTVENCVVKDSNIHHGDYDALGVVVGVNGGTIRNCASISNTMTRRFSSTKDICGFVWSNSGSIENCFNYDCTYQNGSNRYAFTQSNTGTITNCYYYESSETISDTVVNAKTADQFASGEVAYLLNGSTSTGELVWGQTLTGENKQACPVLGGAKVYYGYTACNSTEKSYSNSEIGNEKPQHIFEEDSNGFCTVCGAYEQPETDEKGVYQISNAGELYWFMEYVNAGNKSVNAVLTDNIVVNSGTFSTDNAGNPLYNGEAISETNKPVEWTPINKYTGTFNGQNHTISGLYFNNTSQSYVGLFGITNEGAQIKNVGVINLSFISKGSVGGICACNDKGTITNCYSSGTVSGASYYVGGVCGRNQSGTITNCYNTGDVSGSEDVGGVCGINQTNGTITNCYNTGDVSGDVYVGGVCGSNYDATITNCYSRGTVSGSEKVGGVCGYNNLGTVTNCYSRGTVSGSEDVGGVCGYNNLGTVTNCYYDSTVYTGDAVGYSNGTTTDVEGKTADQFASGEVAYLLNGSSSENVTWYQKLLTDTYPVLDSKHGIVYSVFKCDGTTPAGYSNKNKNEPHIDENGDDYCDNCGVIYNGIGAHLAGYSVSLNGSIGVNFHMDLTQDVLDDNEAYMLFTLPNGTTQKVMVSDAKAKESTVIEGKTYYIFTCNVAAKEMTDTIQAQLITSDGSKTQVYEYSVREYAEKILSGSYDYETIELVEAMLHYGAYSQEWFGYNTTNLANAELDILDLSEADDWDGFDPIITNDENVGSFTSAYLTLESDTAINLKFKLADGVSFEDLTFVVEDTLGNVVPVTIDTTENVCLITLTGIKASDLDTMYDFSVTDKEGNESAILYSAMSYACAVANSEMDQKLKNVTAALRIFNIKANEKFE